MSKSKQTQKALRDKLYRLYEDTYREAPSDDSVFMSEDILSFDELKAGVTSKVSKGKFDDSECQRYSQKVLRAFCFIANQMVNHLPEKPSSKTDNIFVQSLMQANLLDAYKTNVMFLGLQTGGNMARFYDRTTQEAALLFANQLVESTLQSIEEANIWGAATLYKNNAYIFEADIGGLRFDVRETGVSARLKTSIAQSQELVLVAKKTKESLIECNEGATVDESSTLPNEISLETDQSVVPTLDESTVDESGTLPNEISSETDQSVVSTLNGSGVEDSFEIAGEIGVALTNLQAFCNAVRDKKYKDTLSIFVDLNALKHALHLVKIEVKSEAHWPMSSYSNSNTILLGAIVNAVEKGLPKAIQDAQQREHDVCSVQESSIECNESATVDESSTLLNEISSETDQSVVSTLNGSRVEDSFEIAGEIGVALTNLQAFCNAVRDKKYKDTLSIFVDLNALKHALHLVKIEVPDAEHWLKSSYSNSNKTLLGAIVNAVKKRLPKAIQDAQQREHEAILAAQQREHDMCSVIENLRTAKVSLNHTLNKEITSLQDILQMEKLIKDTSTLCIDIKPHVQTLFEGFDIPSDLERDFNAFMSDISNAISTFDVSRTTEARLKQALQQKDKLFFENTQGLFDNHLSNVFTKVSIFWQLLCWFTLGCLGYKTPHQERREHIGALRESFKMYLTKPTQENYKNLQLELNKVNIPKERHDVATPGSQEEFENLLFDLQDVVQKFPPSPSLNLDLDSDLDSNMIISL